MAWTWRGFGHGEMEDGLQETVAAAVEEMDEAMIQNWNERVRPGDLVYDLGDFSFHNKAKTIEILGRLNGEHHFIRGNHDSGTVASLQDHFASFRDYREIKPGGQKICLFHFPIESFHQVGKGAWHLHGHCHGNFVDESGMARMDVGVDTNDLRPYHLDEITERLKDLHGLPADHHNH